MRIGYLVLLMLVSFAQAAAAQTPSAIGAARDPAAAVSPSLVVDRIMAFDRSGDGRVARNELLERMQPMLDRGDIDRDGTLDRGEIVALAAGAAAPVRASEPFSFAARYGFGDLLGGSSSSHIEDAVDDLRLAGGREAETVAIVEAFRNQHHAAATATLLEEMAAVLTAEQMTDFRDVVTRQLRARVHTFHGSGDARATFSHPNLTMIVTASDHERRVAVYPLSAADRARAEAALLQYRERLRVGEGGQADLMARLAGVLDESERSDLWAALHRRPVVQADAAPRFSVLPADVPMNTLANLIQQVRLRSNGERSVASATGTPETAR